LLFTFSASDVTASEFDRDVTSIWAWEHEQHLKEYKAGKLESGDQLYLYTEIGALNQK